MVNAWFQAKIVLVGWTASESQRSNNGQAEREGDSPLTYKKS